MAERLFIPQQKLESWIESGEVTFENNILTLLAEKKSYTVEPAVRMLSMIDGKDAQGLCGQALTVAEIIAKKGEHYRDSVILGDAAYQCEEGFIGTIHGKPIAAPPQLAVSAPVVPPVLVPPPPAAAAVSVVPKAAPTVPSAAPAVPPPSSEPKAEGDDSADLLAAFMLKHM